MGRPKAALPFEGEPLLARVVRRIAPVCRRIVVAAAPDQELPALPASVLVARDARPGCGPLEGLAAGLEALGAEVEAVLVTTTDAPFVEPRLAARLDELRREGPGAPWEAAVPLVDGRAQPLMAVYASSVGAIVRALLAEDRRRATLVAERARTRFVGEAELYEDAELAAVDPGRRALRGVNTPEEYEAALRGR
jgi:molybdopterin-guanine dinucleotide biosynthesis protein A